MSNTSLDGVKLKISAGRFAIVDPEDYEWLAAKPWSFWVVANKTVGYAARVEIVDGKRVKCPMHRVIAQHYGWYTDGCDIDHINGDRLDNRKCNLRVATRRQNAANRGTNKNNKSGYKGVNLYDPVRMVWRAQIMHNGKKISLGYYRTAEEAALAYNHAAKEYFGEFAHQNKVEGVTTFTRLKGRGK